MYCINDFNLCFIIMGNPEFNGKKFDYWSDDYNDEYGVWNNDMRAKQFFYEWDGVIAPNKSKAIEKAKQMNILEEKNEN